MYGRRLGRPQAPVAEGGPVGFSDGGNRRDWFPGARGGCGRPRRRPNGDVHLINALILTDIIGFISRGQSIVSPFNQGQSIVSPLDLKILKENLCPFRLNSDSL